MNNVWTESYCFSFFPFVEVLTPNVTVFGVRAFREVMKIKQGHKGETLIQQDWCPYMKRKKQQESV